MMRIIRIILKVINFDIIEVFSVTSGFIQFHESYRI